MANLSLKARRQLARGFGRQDVRNIGSRTFRGIGNRATLTTAMSGSNNDIRLIARDTGTGSNSVTFRIVVSGNSTPLSVSVSTLAITVNSATNGGGTATSTADEVIKALKASSAAKALVWPSRAPANDGTGVVAALSATNLAGAV